MKKTKLILAILLVAVLAGATWATCPPGTHRVYSDIIQHPPGDGQWEDTGGTWCVSYGHEEIIGAPGEVGGASCDSEGACQAWGNEFLFYGDCMIGVVHSVFTSHYCTIYCDNHQGPWEILGETSCQ